MNSNMWWLVLAGLGLACQGVEPDSENTQSVDDELAAGATEVVRLGAAHNVLLNATGYNPKFDDQAAPWASTRPDFAQALRESGSTMIRYPGGTFVNSWDYNADRLFPAKRSNAHTGWVNTGRVEPQRVAEAIDADHRPRYDLDDLALVAAGPGAVNVVFHMNMITPGQDFYESAEGFGVQLDPHPGIAYDRTHPDDWYRMLDDRYARFKGMLERATSRGIRVRFIELGNEYYFGHRYTVDTFPTGRSHGVAANYIAGRLKRDFGAGLKIAATASCVPGTTNDSRRERWNAGLYDVLDHEEVTHVTMHAYNALEKLDHYGEASFQRAIAGWISGTDGKFEESGANDTFLKNEADWRVWYTETNANWDGTLQQGETTPADEAKWAQNLADAYSVIHLYDHGNAAMLLQFQFNNQVRAEPVDSHLLYNRALALQPFMRASVGSTHATLLHIPSQVTIPGTARSVVQGMCFEADRVRCFVVNLASRPAKLDLSAALPGTAAVRLAGYRNDLDATGVPIEVARTAPVEGAVIPGYAVVEIERP